MPSAIARNNVRILGDGTRPMLFAHGFGCDQSMWRFVTPAFEKDYRIVLFDYVGSGGTIPAHYDAERYSSLDGYARDLLDIVEELDLRDVVVVAHSVSGVVAALAAGRAPDRFSNLIMIGPSPRYVNDPPRYEGGFEREDILELLDLMEKNFIGWAAFLAPLVMKNPEQPVLTAELEQSFCSSDPRITRRFAEVTFLSDNRADLSWVRTPTLILQCSDDAIAPTSVGEFVHRQIEGSEIRFMKATGHCPHMSHPAETIDLMKEYLGSRE